jgi:NitT/TauT family transport system substrate-binding protein
MKKIITILLMILILTGCTKTNSVKIKILIPDGIPTIALGGLFDEENFEVTIVSGPDLLTSELIQDNYDIIVAPLTAGAKLYIKGSLKYKVESILTFGNSYLISRRDIKLDSMADLEGKTIAAFGMNNTPDIILKAALEEAGVVSEIEYENSVNDALTNRFLTNDIDYLLTAEPILTKIQTTMKIDINIIDLQAVLKSEIALIPQAAIFVKESNENININNFLNKVEDNVLYLNSNPQIYADTLVSLDANKYPSFAKLGSPLIALSIPKSNIDYLKVIDNKTLIEKYFQIINKYNPNILGNSIPSDGFYNEKK